MVEKVETEEKKTKKKPKGVRFSKRLTARICEFLREGYSVNHITKLDDMPSQKTYYQWRTNNAYFRDETDKAKLDGCQAIADSIQDIADDSRNDYMEEVDKDGRSRMVFDRENVARSKLRVDVRMWYLSKILPKQFGDKIEVQHDASDDLAEILKAARLRAHNRE